MCNHPSLIYFINKIQLFCSLPLSPKPNYNSFSSSIMGTVQWSQLQTELLEFIFSKLSFVDQVRFKAVCSSWLVSGLSYMSSPQQIFTHHTPFLMLPPKEEEADDENSTRLYSIEEKRVYNYKNAPKELRDSCCVGSSHGWLVILDQKSNPYLLNLFSSTKIQLPTKETFPNLNREVAFEYLQKWVLIKKGVLSSNPSCNIDYVVMIIYNNGSRLAFCKHGACAWTDLNGNYRTYADILCYNNQLFALGCEGSIEVWDFNNSKDDFLVKTINIQPSFPNKIPQFEMYSCSDLYSSHLYLVESCGDVLLVARFVGEFVCNGKPIYEADLLTIEDTQPLLCPYQTLDFCVYKLDFDQKKWLDVENMNDRVLFLGGSHSVSLSAQEHPEYKRNSIYFTDNYWDRMDEDYFYGGHDIGVFGLEDKSVEMFYHLIDSDVMRLEPTPFWVFPTIGN